VQSSKNLLISLSKWASGQQENFLSDAFVHLLNVLAQEAPDAFSMILGQMTAGVMRPTIESAPTFRLETQISTDVGTPDIEITGPGCYGLIEVKDESGVKVEQLVRYAGLISRNESPSKCLVLLTRHHFANPGIPVLVESVTWTQIAQWLTNPQINNQCGQGALNAIEQFVEFLEAKGMSVKRAGWEMVAGIEQFKNFKVMLREAMESAGAHRVWTAYGSDFQGWAIPDGSTTVSAFYVFVRFDEPEILRFMCKSTYVNGTHYENWEVNPSDPDSLIRYLDLNSEETHFFSRSLDSQVRMLEDFVTSCLAQTTYFEKSNTRDGGEII
jgi:hypothetical protein